MSNTPTMSDKKQMPQETLSMRDHFANRKSSHLASAVVKPHALLLAKHQQPHKFPAMGSAGASAQ